MKDIRVIGFDLDQTLYPKLPQIDEAIQKYIYVKISEHKNCSLEEARGLFTAHYPRLSGSKTLKEIGIPNGGNIVQEALERADIDEFLQPNPQVISLLKDLKEKYGTISLITGSHRSITERKLAKLNFPLEFFDCIITGETPKSDGTAFRIWIEEFQKKDPSLRPEHFLYVGDRVSTDAEMPHSLGMNSLIVNVKIDDKIPFKQFTSLFDIRTELLE